MENLEGKIKFDLFDDNQITKLIKLIAGREYWKYKGRVSYPKLEYEDFVQQGWLTVCMIRSNGGPNDLNYMGVAVRRAMYRAVENSAIVKTGDKKELWFYISGHEVRMDSMVNEEENVSLADIIPSKDDQYSEVENKIIVQQVMSGLKEEDRIEVERFMQGSPPISRKRRQLFPEKAQRILRGEKVYRNSEAPLKSEIPRVSYDKSKDRWVYYEKIEGKKKVLIRNRSKEVVEDFAKERALKFA